MRAVSQGTEHLAAAAFVVGAEAAVAALAALGVERVVRSSSSRSGHDAMC